MRKAVLACAFPVLLVACGGEIVDPLPTSPTSPTSPPSAPAPAVPAAASEPMPPPAFGQADESKPGTIRTDLDDPTAAAICARKEAVRGSFTADTHFALGKAVDVGARPASERVIVESGGAKTYFNELGFTFQLPDVRGQDAKHGASHTQPWIFYSVSLSSPTPRPDAFTPGKEEAVRVALVMSGEDVCYADGSTAGSGAGAPDDFGGKLVITNRTPTLIEGTLVLEKQTMPGTEHMEGARLTFRAPIGPDPSASEQVCCLKGP